MYSLRNRDKVPWEVPQCACCMATWLVALLYSLGRTLPYRVHDRQRHQQHTRLRHPFFEAKQKGETERRGVSSTPSSSDFLAVSCVSGGVELPNMICAAGMAIWKGWQAVACEMDDEFNHRLIESNNPHPLRPFITLCNLYSVIA